MYPPATPRLSKVLRIPMHPTPLPAVPCRCSARYRDAARPPLQLCCPAVELDHWRCAARQGQLAPRHCAAGGLPCRSAPGCHSAAGAGPEVLGGALWRQAGGAEPALFGARRAGGGLTGSWVARQASLTQTFAYHPNFDSSVCQLLVLDAGS